MTEKIDSNEIELEEKQEELSEEKDNKKKKRTKKNGPAERKIIKKIVRVVKEAETVKQKEPLEDLVPTTIEPVEEKSSVKKEKKPSKRKKKWPFVLLLLLLLLGGVLWYASPYLRIYIGNYLYNQGRYEDTIVIVQGMTDSEEAKHIIEDCDYQIAERSAEYILNNDKELKEYGLKLDRVCEQKNSLDYKGKNEATSFVAEYVNDRFTYRGTYTANIAKKDSGEWEITVYSKKGFQIIPVKKPSKVMAGSVVVEKYPEARYKETRQISESEVVYVFELMTYDKPLYRTGYEIGVNYTYDIPGDTWKMVELKEELTESTQIPLKQFSSSIFSINLPESWLMDRNEEVHLRSNKNPDQADHDYIYTFYADKEKKNVAMKISASFAFDKKASVISGKESISGKKIGEGSLSQTGNTIKVSFQPKVKGMNCDFIIEGYGISKDELQKIIDTIVIGERRYRIAVIAEGIVNIRSEYSTKTGKIVSKAKTGDTFLAHRAILSEGLTWYEIDENQWIADNNGEWLLVE